MEGFKDDASKNKKTLDGKLAAVGVAAAIAMGTAMNDAEARTTSETSDTNPAIQQTEKALSEQGVPVKIEFQHGLGDSLRVTKDGKLVVERNEGVHRKGDGKVLEKLLPLLTPKRVIFEIEANEAIKKYDIEGLSEKVEGTRIHISPYARALMQYMGVSYANGELRFAGTLVDLTGANSDQHNERVGITGVQLEERLVACVEEMNKDGRSVQELVYFLDKNGSKYDMSQGTYEQVKAYCR